MCCTSIARLSSLPAFPCHAVQVTELDPPGLPDAIARLPNLQRCYSVPYGLQVAAALAAGPWLHSICWLCLNIQSMASNIAVLRGAPALELLDVCGDFWFNWSSPAAAALFDWLAVHPSLRRVCFNEWCRINAYAFHGSVFAASLEQLCRRRPGLHVQCYKTVVGQSHFLQLLDADCP